MQPAHRDELGGARLAGGGPPRRRPIPLARNPAGPPGGSLLEDALQDELAGAGVPDLQAHGAAPAGLSGPVAHESAPGGTPARAAGTG